ncbi:MAG: ABC transporter ATP-binding protein [Symbiobacterium sp.]|uniref:ABC transporter ATP-binding protein n=1 Tax=Symbiobacterium sp. TaxID=1971213 RepID=UPI003464784A
MAETVIETHGLVKRYGDFTAVDGLDLEVQSGEVFGLLGPNGAGKTTTILMLLGLTEPTEGSIRVLGHDPVREPLAVKRLTGYLPDNVGFYDELTGRQNLFYTADLNGLSRKEAAAQIDRLLERVGLTHAADTKVGAYSRGMRQRLGVADVLLKRPRLVIMDEPTLGLDPEGARAFLRLIRELADEGMTVLLSSHLLHQVQAVCDRVAIFVKGQMIACGRVEELADQALAGEPLRLEVELSPCPPALLAELERLDGVESLRRLDATEHAADDELRRPVATPQGAGESSVRVELVCRRELRPEVSRLVAAHGAAVMHLTQVGRSLDDIYRRYFAEGGDGDGRPSKGAA